MRYFDTNSTYKTTVKYRPCLLPDSTAPSQHGIEIPEDTRSPTWLRRDPTPANIQESRPTDSILRMAFSIKTGRTPSALCPSLKPNSAKYLSSKDVEAGA